MRILLLLIVLITACDRPATVVGRKYSLMKNLPCVYTATDAILLHKNGDHRQAIKDKKAFWLPSEIPAIALAVDSTWVQVEITQYAIYPKLRGCKCYIPMRYW